MAAERSRLLEGLEGMSEEEQLRQVMELSEREAEAEAEIYSDEEQLRQAMELSKLTEFTTEEETTKLAIAIEVSEREATNLDHELEGALKEEEATKFAIEASEREANLQELENALKLSLRKALSNHSSR